ncbi:MAG: ferredoxin [Pseudomonadales bacterium]|nr:ferredoxin [Pseudomonadales bacterium]
MKIQVDLELCQGHSVCLEECPEVFDVAETDEGYPKVLVLNENPAEDLREKVQKAAKFCPNHVITIIEDECL